MGCGHSKTQVQAKQEPEPSKPIAPAASKKSDKIVIKDALLDLNDDYNIGKVLGRGQFGVTRVAEEKKTGDKYACKTIGKRKLKTADDIEDVRREVEIMQHLKGDPNVVDLVAVYEDKDSVHLVMELCAGGELFDRIVSRGHYTEKDAAELCRTIVEVVAHCHKMGVIHRDLKPENFLLKDKSKDARLKCTDFGLSVFFKPGQRFHEIVGSAFYVAPEVLKRDYGSEADIWSCGVILYILLSGVPPFWGDTEQQIFSSVLEGKLDFESDPWPKISSEAKSCVAAMLKMDPAKRASADEILRHEWMKENGVASDRPLDNVILQRMKHFSNMNKLKKEALKFIASNLKPSEIAGLKAVFQAIDEDNSGTITVEELRDGMRKQGSTLIPEELDKLIKSMDLDNSGTIDYEEFITATLNLATLQKEEHLRKAFEKFDIDNNGYITKDELQDALKELGSDVEGDINEILTQVDKDNDGRIDYDEFVSMMLGGNEATVRQSHVGKE